MSSPQFGSIPQRSTLKNSLCVSLIGFWWLSAVVNGWSPKWQLQIRIGSGKGRLVPSKNGWSVYQRLADAKYKTSRSCNHCFNVLTRKILSNLVLHTICRLRKLLDWQNWDRSTFPHSVMYCKAWYKEALVMGITSSSIQSSITADLRVPFSKLERMEYYTLYFPYSLLAILGSRKS
jgi:hypothetical protein